MGSSLFSPSYVTLYCVSVTGSSSWLSVFLHMPVHLSKLCFSIQAVCAVRESWLIWARSHPESSFRACGPYLHIFRHLVWDLSQRGDVCYWRVNPLIFQRPFHNPQSHVVGLRSFKKWQDEDSPFFFVLPPCVSYHMHAYLESHVISHTALKMECSKPKGISSNGARCCNSQSPLHPKDYIYIF